MKIQMNVNNPYEIYIEKGLIENSLDYILKIYQKQNVYIITDDNVSKLYLDKLENAIKSRFNVKSVIIPHGEENKSMETYLYICKSLLDLNIRRNELLIALGGGVVGDITGFVAATLYRGINYMSIPTTLLADLDSSIGGKTGVDFNNMKNILGAFKQPKLVLIDPNTFKTLPNEEIISGMGELIKHGFIHSPKLIDLLLKKTDITEEVIYESLMCKKYFVEQDVYDQGVRMFLNFGHTFGHAIELENNFKHGYAVIIGMLMAFNYGIDLKISKQKDLDTLKQILKVYDIKYQEFDYKKYLDKIKFDKKNIAGEINFILIDEIGKPVVHKIKEQDL